MQEIFTMKNFVIYILAINLIGFFIMWLDKHKAGTTAGMFVFRHKTKKLNFLIGFPFITILEIILVIYYLVK